MLMCPFPRHCCDNPEREYISLKFALVGRCLLAPSFSSLTFSNLIGTHLCCRWFQDIARFLLCQLEIVAIVNDGVVYTEVCSSRISQTLALGCLMELNLSML